MSSPMTDPSTATLRELYDSHVAGDAAATAELNRRAAVARGWTELEFKWDGTIGRTGELMGRSPERKYRSATRYATDLSAAATVKVPDGYGIRAGILSSGGIWGCTLKNDKPDLDSFMFGRFDHEAAARLCAALTCIDHAEVNHG